MFAFGEDPNLLFFEKKTFYFSVEGETYRVLTIDEDASREYYMGAIYNWLGSEWGGEIGTISTKDNGEEITIIAQSLNGEEKQFPNFTPFSKVVEFIISENRKFYTEGAEW